MLVLRSTAAGGRGVHWEGTTDGAGKVHLVTTLAGEDATRDLQIASLEANYGVVGSTRVTVKTGAGVFYGYSIVGNAAAGAMNLYDGLSTAGQDIEGTAGVTVGTSSERMISPGKRFTTGLHAAVSATLASSTMILVWYT